MFADLALARRLEGACALMGVESARTHALRRPELGATVAAVAGGFAVYYGPGSPLSQAQGLGLNGPVEESEIERMEAFFHDRECSAHIEVCTPADPSLLALLGRRGYRAEEQSHTLARALGPGAILAASSSEARVEQVGPEGALAWAETVMRSFFEGPEDPPPEMLEMGIETVSTPATSCWLARVGGAPAGGGALSVHRRIALLAGDGTLPAFRRRGVQTALLHARLIEAVALGCDFATICTLPASASQRNAERLGFRVVYARTLFVRELPTP